MKNSKVNGHQNVLYVSMYSDHTNEQTIKCFSLPLTVKVEIGPADGRVWVEFKQLDAKMNWQVLALMAANPSVLPPNLESLLKEHEIERKVAEKTLSWITAYLQNGTFRVDEEADAYNTFHLPVVARKVERMLEQLYVKLGESGMNAQ